MRRHGVQGGPGRRVGLGAEQFPCPAHGGQAFLPLLCGGRGPGPGQEARGAPGGGRAPRDQDLVQPIAELRDALDVARQDEYPQQFLQQPGHCLGRCVRGIGGQFQATVEEFHRGQQRAP